MCRVNRYGVGGGGGMWRLKDFGKKKDWWMREGKLNNAKKLLRIVRKKVEQCQEVDVCVPINEKDVGQKRWSC